MKTREQRYSPLPLQKYVYHSKNGPGRYTFIFQQQPDGRWRGYLVVASDEPPPSGRSRKSLHAVAFTGPVDSFESARSLAAFWADASEKHLRQGRRSRGRIGYWSESTKHD